MVYNIIYYIILCIIINPKKYYYSNIIFFLIKFKEICNKKYDFNTNSIVLEHVYNVKCAKNLNI